MKAKIIYIVSFLAAFAFVTLAIIELNNTYKNIFDLNFTKVEKLELPDELKNTAAGLEMTHLKDYFRREFKKELLDSIKASSYMRIDTVYKEIVKDEQLLDSLAKLNEELLALQTQLKRREEQTIPEQPVEDEVNNEEVNVEEWAKDTAKLFESMEPKQAAKVLTTYSDNEARSIIYNMKNKKAAEILSLLNPEFVNSITKPRL